MLSALSLIDAGANANAEERVAMMVNSVDFMLNI